MRDVRRGRIEAVIAYKLDRLGRSLPHLAQLISEMTAQSVALVVPGQGIDTGAANPASQIQLNILIAVAEFEPILSATVFAQDYVQRRRAVFDRADQKR